MLQITRLYGPFECEYFLSKYRGPYSLYYHVDSGNGTPNECERLWYVDHHDFNLYNP